MSAETHQETHTFQTEVKQLLHLMIHSLYSNREIFLRELVSNASDAADKLRFEAISRPELLESTADLAVRVSFDADAGSVTVSDNGIGMSRDEVVANLGTIARSGTSEFLASLTGDTKADARLIGQFGVGFYSSFIVADRVEVFSRRADLPAADGVHWTSSADGEFTVANADRPERGTTVVLHLKEDAREFANGWRLRQLVRRYSDHISFPVMMPVEGDGEGADDDAPTEERVNTASALWTRPKGEIDAEEYGEFYKHIAHDFEDPLAWSHNRVEGKREYTSLLYVPRRAPFDLWNRESPRGLKLYVQRVFIMDDAEQFLPLYLRFVRGVVDSSDLPLNVSREILQSDASVAAMRGALTRRALDLVGTVAADRPDDYAAFWKEFGAVLKEGPAEDPGNAERIAALLRFSTTRSDSDTQDRSLDQYIGDMPEGQECIYYLVGDNWNAVRRSPHLEMLRKKGIEVLLLHDRIDEWLMSHLREYKEKAFADITRGELDLGALGGEDDATPAEDSAGLVERLKSLYGERVADVRGSRRLTDSPACLVAAEDDPGIQMRRILEAAGQTVPPSHPTLEINAGHPLVRRLEDAEGDRFADLAWVMLDQASLSAGGELPDPGAYVDRVNRLLVELTG